MLWSILFTVLGLMLFNVAFLPYISLDGGTATQAMTAVPQEVDYNEKDQRQEPDNFDVDKIIDFTKKTACRHNQQVINTLVELWYIQNNAQWPRDDLSDIGRDKDYFPKGIPRCPITGAPYHLDPITHRVMGHDHGDIRNPIGYEIETDGDEYPEQR